MELYDTGHGMESSSLSRANDRALHGQHRGTIAAAVVTLSEVLDSIPVNVTVALLKTDMQGKDYAALASAGTALRRAPYLKTEVYLGGRSAYAGVRNDLCADFLPHLHGLGYRLTALVGLETRRATLRSSAEAEQYCRRVHQGESSAAHALAFEADAYWTLQGTRLPSPPAGWFDADRAGSLPPNQRAEAAMARAWLNNSRPGHCGATVEGDEGDCSRGRRGSWGLGTGAMSWQAAARECLARCAACRRCNHISLALDLRDCSWYHSCASTLPAPGGHKILSGHVVAAVDGTRRAARQNT